MSAGKGDTPRPVNLQRYRENYDRIFRKSHEQRTNPSDIQPGPRVSDAHAGPAQDGRVPAPQTLPRRRGRPRKIKP